MREQKGAWVRSLEMFNVVALALLNFAAHLRWKGGFRGGNMNDHGNKLDDELPESIFHHVGSQSASYPVSVQ